MRRFVVALLVLACGGLPLGVACARTPDWVQGMYWSVHGRDTVQDLEPAAKQGDRNAQFQLGTGLLYGRGKFRTDEEEGLRWLRKAAEQQQPAAALHLGAYLAQQKGSTDEAIGWLRRAASVDPAASRTESSAPLLRKPVRDDLIAARILSMLLLAGPGAAEGADWLRKASEQGDRGSQMLLGTAFIDGRGVPKDRAKGLELILRARGRVTLTALSVAALVHAEGIGAPADPKEAARMLGAKSNSDAESYYYVGRLYHQGFWYEGAERPLVDWYFRRAGVTEESLAQFYGRQQDSGTYRWADADKALQWYRRGADAGHVGAQVNLAVIHFDYTSPHWNCAEGLKWLKPAAERGDPTALLNIGSLYWSGPHRTTFRIGIGMEEQPRGVRVTEVLPDSPAARAAIRENDLVVSINGQSINMNDLRERVSRSEGKAIMVGIERPGEPAKLSFRLVPEKHVAACPGAESVGLRIDQEEAVRWFGKSADAGHLSGLFFLARAYREGKGVPRDYVKAMDLYRKGADLGDWEAAQALAHMYGSGEGVEKNKELSDQWFRKAVALKHTSLGKSSGSYFLPQ